MALTDIIRKDPIITTVSVEYLRDNPAECEARYGRHYATYVTIPEISERWSRVISRICAGQSAVGSVYAPYGYGKTGAALDLWQLCEKAGILATPPFMCTMINDLLVAAHNWIAYRLTQARPDLVPELETAYDQTRLRTNEEWVHQISTEHNVPADKAREILNDLQAQGSLRLDALPANVLRYLRQAVRIVLAAGFKGLVLIPDEFKLFAEFSKDSDANISRLTQLVWGVRDEEMPLGLVISMPEDVFAEIRLKSGDVAQRLGSHQALINLHQVYGGAFPRQLWRQLSKSFALSADEAACITEDAMDAIGQFCSRVEHFNGPRSVVATFKQAALKFQDHRTPYDVFDFVDSYCAGLVVFDGKESETKGALHGLLTLHANDGELMLKAASLLAAFPDGCAEAVAQRLGVSAEIEELARTHLGHRVIMQALGPTLAIYKLGVDSDVITESLRYFRKLFSHGDSGARRGALRGFWNFVLPKLLADRKGTAVVGWTGRDSWTVDEGLSETRECTLVGGASKEYPLRKVDLRVTGRASHWAFRDATAHLSVSVLLDFSSGATSELRIVKPDECAIRLAAGNVIDTHQIPGDIAKLRDIFLPQDVTPYMLLAASDFLDTQLLKSQSQSEQDKRIAQYIVGTSFAQRVIRELFAPSLNANGALGGLAIGEAFLEQLIDALMRRRYPDYLTLEAAPVQILEKYAQALESGVAPQLSLAQKRGFAEIRETKSRISTKFGYASHATFRDVAKSHFSSLLDVVEWEGAGNESTATIKLKGHPLETDILNMLRASKEGLSVEGQTVSAIVLTSAYAAASEKGYSPNEVEFVVRLLRGRGHVASTEVKGQTLLHAVPHKFTAAELGQSYKDFLARIQEYVSIVGISPDKLFQRVGWDLTPGIQDLIRQEKAGIDVEVELDEIHHAFRALSIVLENSIEAKLVEVAGGIHSLAQLCAQRKDSQRPPILDAQKKPFAPTDFSALLQTMQVELAKRFVKTQSTYDQLHKSLLALFQKYNNAKANRDLDLLGVLRELDTSSRDLRRDYDDTEIRWRDLGADSINLERWHTLSSNISSFVVELLQMGEDRSVAGDFLKQLRSGPVFRIREHLASKKLDALADWEVFASSFGALRDEWSQAVQMRRREFLDRAECYTSILGSAGITKVVLDAVYDDVDPESSYLRLVQDVRTLIDGVGNRAKQYLGEMGNELLKARLIYGLGKDDLRDEVERQWEAMTADLGRLFAQLGPSVIQDVGQFAAWVDVLRPFTQPEGSISSLRAQVVEVVRGATAVPLNPDEEQVLTTIRSHSGNLTEAFVQLLQPDAGYNSLEGLLPIIIALYRKGRINLEAQVIGAEEQ